jgi:hypothetical protein
MTESALTATAIAAEFVLTLLGLGLLWRLRFSAEARARATPSALAAWEAPLSEFFLFLWLMVLCGLVVQLGAGYAIRRLPFSTDENLSLAGTTAHVGALAGIFLFRRFFATTASAPAHTGLNPLLSGAATFLLALPVVYAVGFAWQGALGLCGFELEKQGLVDVLQNSRSVAFQALMILMATVVVPVTEESFFRAGLFRYTRTRLPRWASLLAPACLFGALHANLATFAPLVALGVIFSLAYERTGRIGTAMVAHGLFNLHTVALIFAGLGT